MYVLSTSPEDGPDGVLGLSGGLFSAIVTVRTGDQSLSSSCSSCAFALT